MPVSRQRALGGGARRLLATIPSLCEALQALVSLAGKKRKSLSSFLSFAGTDLNGETSCRRHPALGLACDCTAARKSGRRLEAGTPRRLFTLE